MEPQLLANGDFAANSRLPEECCHAQTLEAFGTLRVLPGAIWAAPTAAAGATTLRPSLDFSQLRC
jgi:hypothetical protein